MSYKSPLSGSGSPASGNSPWSSERVAQQQAYTTDPKYKKYTQQVEKCLNSFDNVHEWADCIAFLKQLLKTFQSYMQFKEVPKKLVVAKRLAQCLNPALPTGVHQRALDVYAHILAVSGSEGLKQNLGLWSSGLFPFFEYAATSVKPTLLNLYDTHYLPLENDLRPITKAFIIALLPGLEEETGEFFDKVLALLDRISGTVGPAFFFQNIWLVMLTTPSARETSLNLLSRRLPPLNADDDVASIVGRDIGLMIRAFSSALEDDNLLVRRGALDLLLTSLRIDSRAVKDKAQPHDKIILMRAATSVVLRRDLTLNRRLYKWLLGPSESSQHQIAYFKEHAMQLMGETLKDEMSTPSGEYSQSRPYKIFISLLDRWEIGAVLTDSIVCDVFIAIKQLVEKGSGEEREEVVLTGSTLYEAVEPAILWKLLFTAMSKEINGNKGTFEVIRLVVFILRTFASSHDEEVQTIHLPVIFSGIQDLLNGQIGLSPSLLGSTLMMEVLLLQAEMLKHIPASALLKRPELTEDAQAVSSTQGSFNFACTFYGLEKPLTGTIAALDVAQSYEMPLVLAFRRAIYLSVLSANAIQEELGNNTERKPLSTTIQDVFSLTLQELQGLVDRIKLPITVKTWDPTNWLDAVLAYFALNTARFAIVDQIVTLALTMHKCTALQPKLNIEERSIMRRIVNKLLSYLSSSNTSYHARSVSLIWQLESTSTKPFVEATLCQQMNHPEHRNTEDAYEAFGVLWRLSDDTSLPGFKWKIPMMIVLDTLKSDDPSLRRIGETWMRCSLKSYIRVLDPILHDLLDPSIRSISTVNKVHTKELPGCIYESPFDQRYIQHLLETLLSVIQFGGLGFAKTARSTMIRKSNHRGLIQRAESAGIIDKDATYLDVLLDVLLRFVQCEPKSSCLSSMLPLIAVIQSTSIDLLQAIISRGEIDIMSVEGIETVAIAKLYFCVHRGRLDLQNKLLHLLHSLISASISYGHLPAIGPSTSGKSRQSELSGTSSIAMDSSDLQDPSRANSALGGRAYPLNSLLTQTLIDGIATPTNRPILQHWLDFVLMAVPQFQPTLQVAVNPLNECICKQLVLALVDLQKVASPSSGAGGEVTLTTTDAEVIMLLNALERLVLLNLAASYDYGLSEDDGVGASEKLTQESGGLFGYMSNVFSTENPLTVVEEQFTARSPGYRSLHEGTRVLFLVWATTVWSKPSVWSPQDDSLSLITSRSRTRCRRVLEHLFRMHSAEVLEFIIDFWNKDSLDPLLIIHPTAAFELVDVLVANATHVVHMICESITYRTGSVSEKGRKQALNPELSDQGLFKFLEHYLQRLEGPLAVQVWPRFISLAKDFSGNIKEFRVQMYSVFRCLSVLAAKIAPTTAMEDRKIRKELQDTYSKLLESCVSYVGRSTDQSSWIRRTTKETTTSNGRDSPTPRGDILEEKLDSSVNSLIDNVKIDEGIDLPAQINKFIATDVLPNIRRYLIDTDRVSAACSNIVYYIVNPAIKGKSRPLDIDDRIVDVLRELSKLSMALKAWKTPVFEIFSNNQLFNGSCEAAYRWKPIIRSFFDFDKTAFPELLAKIATPPSANIFTNREYEMLVRSLNLRRLSFILFTGEKNHFLTQLPSIQEKLVDILKNTSTPMVQSEVYLCIRVLLCRLSPHNLTSFWPVILTELYRVFEQLMTTLPSDGSEDLQLVLAASKCLDLLITLQTEEFQTYQWIFITDTVDAVYRPDHWRPDAMMDLLAEVVGNLPAAVGYPTQDGVSSPGLQTYTKHRRPMRRPTLNYLRTIDSMRDLVPFLSNISVSSYESVYASNGNVDWEAVERGLMDDMFDGPAS